MNLGTAYVTIRAKRDALKRDLDLAKSDFANTTKGIQAKLAAIDFKAVGLAAAAAAAVIGYEFKKAIGVASDLQETTSKFETVFKDQKKSAYDWARALRDGYAMSTQESRKYLASVQDLLVPMGMASKRAGELSFKIVKLSADLGSFNNLPTAQVMDDIQSALVGNYETMKKYGVVLNAAVVQEKARALGLVSGKQALTASDKALAAYTLMVEGSSAAIGDMARTSDGYANQQKKLQANWADLQATLGEGLLPVATDMVSKMNDWFKVNENLLSQEIPHYMGMVAGAFETAASWAGIYVKALKAVAEFHPAAILADEIKGYKWLYNKISGGPDVDPNASTSAFRGMEMAGYGGAKGIGYDFTTPSAPAAGDAVLKSMGLDQTTKDRIDDELDGYIGLVDEYYAELRRKYKEAFDDEDAFFTGDELADIVERADDATNAMQGMAKDASWSMQSAFSDFFDSTSEGFLSLENLVQNVARSINSAIVDNISSTLVSSMFKGMGLTASAQGNVFSGGHFVPFARGGVVSQPTVFPFADGVGLMGEAGAEAIMPLSRLPGGDLGVKAQGAAAPEIAINITNESGQPIEAETRGIQQSPDKIIANMVIKRKMTSRSFRQSLRS